MTTQRKVFVYRLAVEYPPGSLVLGWAPAGWEPATGGYDPVSGEPYDEDEFRWPQVRPYLSASGAKRRAELLRKFGAEVTIRRSLPVEWPEDEAATAAGEGNE